MYFRFTTLIFNLEVLMSVMLWTAIIFYLIYKPRYIRRKQPFTTQHLFQENDL